MKMKMKPTAGYLKVPAHKYWQRGNWFYFIHGRWYILFMADNMARFVLERQNIVSEFE